MADQGSGRSFTRGGEAAHVVESEAGMLAAAADSGELREVSWSFRRLSPFRVFRVQQTANGDRLE